MIQNYSLGKRKRKTQDWNPDHLPPWHPTLQWQLLMWILFAPHKIVDVQQSEYMRIESNKTGTWLSLVFMLLPLGTLLLAFMLRGGALDLIIPIRMFGVALLCTSMGLAITVAVVTERPFMAFMAFMLSFFGGVIVGMAAAIISEIWITTAYYQARPNWRGFITPVLLIAAHISGLALLLFAR
jgi:hypothetical protein